MTPKAQRIAIATTLGWTNLHIAPGLSGRNPAGNVQALPDWTEDLNAMHEAENTLSQAQQENYSHTLLGLICDPVEVEYGPLNLTQADCLWMILHATAAQRAEAFLRTKGLWRDEELKT